MTYQNMHNNQSRAFLEKISTLKARYFAYAVIPLFALGGLITADQTIYLGIEDGTLDINSLQDIRLTFLHNSNETHIAGLIVISLMVVLIGFAILIHIARWKTHDDVRDVFQ